MAAPAPEGGVSDQEFSLFYIALILIAMGMGGLQSTLKAFGADQFKAHNNEGIVGKLKFRWLNVWWWTGSTLGTVAGMLLILSIDWNPAIGYGVATGIMFVAFVALIAGTCLYEPAPPGGDPLKVVLRVFVAAARNRHLDLPSDANQLYRKTDPEDGEQSLPHTNKLRWLDKAAILETSGDKKETSSDQNIWRLCTVSEVEETKALLQRLPIWTTFLIYGMVMSMKISFFLLQAKSMNRKIKDPLYFPLTSCIALAAFSSFIVGKLLDYCFVPLLKKFVKLEDELSATKRIGVGMIFSILCCITAALVESKRLRVIKEEKKLISFFWLVPQFFLLGAMDDFAQIGLQDLFYDQFPREEESFGPSFLESVIGLGSFLTSILVKITDKISEKTGDKNYLGWFSDTIDDSHLDYFYWTLAALSFINLCFYGHFSRTYTHNKARIGERSTSTVNAGSEGACACWK